MAFSFVDYTATGGATDFTFNKGYLAQSDVYVELNGVAQTVTTDYTWFDAQTVRFNSGLTGGDLVHIYRSTAFDFQAVYADASIFDDDDMNATYRHAIYVAQEVTDALNLKLGGDGTTWDALSQRIENVADGTGTNDAINFSQLQAAVIAAGNVPTPADPGDVGKVLTALAGGLFAWALGLPDPTGKADRMLSSNATGDDYELDTAANSRTKLGLGSAAVETAGTGANEVLKLDGSAEVPSANLPLASTTIKGALEVATDAEMETATNNQRTVPPSRVHRHPGVSKAWCNILVSAGVPSLQSPSYNCDAPADNGTGDISAVWTADFSTAIYACVASGPNDTTRLNVLHVDSLAAGSANILTFASNASGNSDDLARGVGGEISVVAFGDHA